MKDLTFYDAFHGIGGFRFGLEQAGMRCVGGCEFDEFACKAYGVINDEDCRPTDIRTVDPVQLPGFDCFVFGWPCQDNSIAGQRSGQVKRDKFNEGNRSGLLFEATRIIRVKRPKYFIAENVEGLLTVNDGRDFYATIREFTDMGYDVQWQVLNSSTYVPQNRRRIFFVGHLRGTRRPEIFPFGSENTNIIKVVGKLEGNHDQNSRVYSPNGLAPTLGTMQGGGQIPKILTESGIREITPLEAFRLQSYPDQWYYKLKKAGFKKSRLYKLAGNGVTSEVARQIGLRLATGHLSTESA